MVALMDCGKKPSNTQNIIGHCKRAGPFYSIVFGTRVSNRTTM